MHQFFRAAVTAILAIVLLPAVANAASWNYPSSIAHERQGEAYAVVVRNNGPAPVSVRVTLKVAENVTTDRAYPTTSVVAPKSVQTLLRVRPARQDVKFRFTTSTEQTLGDSAAIHDADAIYRFPFSEGAHVYIAQAFGGRMTTHRNPDNLHAVDFAANAGTLVLCARSGVVVDVDNEYITGGPDPALMYKANSVTVLHDDGTLGRYAHLAAGRYVSVGQYLQAGAPLGRIGNTGFSYGPHLHFAVIRAVVDSAGRVAHASVPINLHNHNPRLTFSPQQGLALTVDYSNPPMHATTTLAGAFSPTDQHATTRVADDAPAGATSERAAVSRPTTDLIAAIPGRR